MRLALYQPDIAGNTGTIIRLATCFGVPVDIIEPCGFPFSDRQLKRSAMDYAHSARIDRRANFEEFMAALGQEGRRIVLLTSKGSLRLPDTKFRPDDVLLMGSESAGVPGDVHEQANLSVRDAVCRDVPRRLAWDWRACLPAPTRRPVPAARRRARGRPDR